MTRALYWIGWLLFVAGLLLHVPFEGAPKFASREVAWLFQASGVAFFVTVMFLNARRKK